MRSLSALLACLTLASQAVAQERPLVVQTGPLTVTVHLSRTAQVFHVVDQLSAWSRFCHGQYARGMQALDDDDREMLELHRRVRARNGWGGGLEQTLYTPLGLDEALEVAASSGLLHPEDVMFESHVLRHFAPRVDALVETEREHLLRFREGVAERLGEMESLVVDIARLCDVEALEVPCYLIANPSDHEFGGGFNGGRLTLEVPREADASGTFLHELFHAFLDARRDEVVQAIEGVDARLDYQTLNEGLAHAISPGLFHADPDGPDPLADRLRRARERGGGLDEYGIRVNGYALALRPIVREALDDGEARLEDLLPRALDAWRSFAELEAARER